MSSILTTGRVSFFFIYSHLSMLYWHRWGEGGVNIFKKISVKFLTSGKKYMLKMSNIRIYGYKKIPLPGQHFVVKCP